MKLIVLSPRVEMAVTNITEHLSFKSGDRIELNEQYHTKPYAATQLVFVDKTYKFVLNTSDLCFLLIDGHLFINYTLINFINFRK